MTYAEIQNSFTNYAERATRLHLVYLSLADNCARLKDMAGYSGFRGRISNQVPDVTQVRQHLAEINALCPAAVESIFRILQTSDSISAALASYLPSVSLPLSNHEALALSHNQMVSGLAQSVRPSYERALELLQTQFGFDPVNTTHGPVPSVQ